MTFQLIDRERAHHAVSLLCSVLNVSRQGYWLWKRRSASARRQEDERLKAGILAAWNASDQTYGAPACRPAPRRRRVGREEAGR